MKHEDEHPDLIWLPEDGPKAKYAIGIGFLFIIGWIFFLLMILAPSCPSSKTPAYYFEYGKHYMTQHEFIKAQKYFTKAIELKPDYYEAYLERITAYEQSDSIHKAIVDYDTILTVFKLTVEQKGQILYLKANDHYKILEDSLACIHWNTACELNAIKACDALRINCKKSK